MAPVVREPQVGYHSFDAKILTAYRGSGTGTLSVGQFDWGGRLLKSNGGVPRFPQNGRKPFAERKGRRELDCDTDKWSRVEIRT
jgi:hypothetical protein